MGRILLLAITVAAVGVLHGDAPAGAQVPTPPHRFYGTVTVNGRVPADGTAVVALIGAVECGRSETAGGGYRIDVLAISMRAGCGGEGTTVRFRAAGSLAAQAAPWRGATFSELNLTVLAQPFDTAALDLTSPCIPEHGAAACDDARARLWNGDQDAWNWLYRSLGAREPSPDRVFEEVLRFRLEAHDPALTAIVATWLGWPFLRITSVHFRGSASNEADEFVEVANLGGTPQEMTGWRLRAGTSGAEFRFQAGWRLAAGQRCRIYTNLSRADSCPGFGFGGSFGLWDNAADTAILVVDAPALIADFTSYRAEAAEQPPPPALRGVAPGQ